MIKALSKWICIAVVLSTNTLMAAVVEGELKQYHTVSILFTGPQLSETSEATFRDYRLQVTFTHTGSGQSITVPGFFAADGQAAETSATAGTKWQVRFRPSRTGTWNYVASFRTGADIAASIEASAGLPTGFDGDAGSFSVSANDKTGRDFRAKGFLTKWDDSTFYYRFDNGEYFLKGGPGSPENFLAYHGFDGTINHGGAGIIHKYLPHVPDWQAGDPSWQEGKGKGIIGAVNYIASTGMNTIYFLLQNVKGDARDVYPWTGGDTEALYTYDVSKLDQWEIVFSHLQANGIHMHMFFHEQENESEIWGGSALSVKRKIYFREMIARFGHHLALTWNLGEEVTIYHVNQAPNKADILKWSDYVALVDAYNHPISSHSHGTLEDSFGYLLGHPSYTGATFQLASGHKKRLFSDIVTWHQKSSDAGIKWPISMDEPHDIYADAEDYWQDDNRKYWIWSTYMAGGFGLEAYMGGRDDFYLEDFRSRDHWFAMNRYALDFFKDNYIPFWEMTSTTSKVSGVAEPKLMFKPEHTYVIYLASGGSPTLDLSGVSGTYEIKWFDPRHGKYVDTDIKTVSGGADRFLGAPPNNPGKDWVILLSNKDVKERPVVTFLEPVAGDVLQASDTIYASVSINTKGGNVKDLKLFVNDEPVSTLTEAPYTWSLTGLSRGHYHAKVVVRTNEGLTRQKSVDFEVQDRASVANMISVDHLRCEYLKNPLGIDVLAPRFNWKIKSKQRMQKQTAYRILVASSRSKLDENMGDLWDTGKVTSDRSIQVAYAGKPLTSRMQCFWKVCVWDKDGQTSAWSKPAQWSMGLLKKSDWQAQWIGYDTLPKPEDIATLPVPGEKGKGKFKQYLPSPHLRREFDVSKAVSRASLYVTAQGHVEMHVNGERVGDEYFTPGWTDYRKRIYYRTYDVTTMLNQGANAVGAILGDGWFRGNISILNQNQYGTKIRLLAQLQIDYADGTSQIIASDPTWKASFGPIILSDMFEGETYDARKEIPGWNKPGYDDSQWATVDTGSEINPLIQAYPGVPVRAVQEIVPVKMTEPKSGAYVFDLGQNFSGWARLKVKGQRGDKIGMQFAEMLNADGTVYTANLRSARAADNYILKGKKEEVWEPHFTFHGFRYVEVTGLRQKPSSDTITGIVIQSDSAMTSSFECSNPMLNQLYRNILWGQRSNYLEVPTDCPQRDERLGWTGDTQVFVRTGAYNQDIGAFFTKWNIDLMDTQNKAGTFGQQAPVFHGHGSPAWADAGVICPWTIYKVYGDVRMVEIHYDAMARFIAYCRSKGLAGPGGGFGDWLAIGSKTPKQLISAAYFGYTTSLMIEIAEALGKEEDAAQYRALFKEICTHFQKTFLKEDGKIQDESQTSYCLALHFNLLSEEQRKQAAAHLVDRIKAKDYHLSVGFVGAPILLPTLTEIGRSDLAYRLIQNTTYPSWGYSIEQGATTIWERWNSYTKKNGFGDVGMNSFNHYAYGACGEWMFRSMLGIDLERPGYKTLLMSPELGQGVTWAKGHYDSIHGRISSDWKVEAGTLKWQVTVPPNTTATLRIPASGISNVTESGSPTNKAKGVTFLRMEKNRAVLKVASGSYEFVSRNYQGK